MEIDDKNLLYTYSKTLEKRAKKIYLKDKESIRKFFKYASQDKILTLALISCY